MDKNELIMYIEQGLSTWKLAELYNTSQPNIRYWLNKYNLKTLNKLKDTKMCPNCNINKPRTDFYKSNNKNSAYCKSCYAIINNSRKQSVKQQAVDYLGGKCSNCGYDKCLAALEFHHLDPTQKDNKYVNMRGKFSDRLKKELDKCVLLCANCHREVHHLSNQDI